MTELEQLKQELEKLTKKVEELEKQEEEQESRYPKKGEKFYCIDSRGDEMIVAVNYHYFYDKDPDTIYAWDFLHGSKDKAKVEWTIKHIELVNEIKKYTRPFIIEKENVFFVRDFKNGVGVLNKYWLFDTDFNSSYGYFESENEINKFRENYTEKYILNFLFEPTDGNYKAVMDWLADQEEQDDKPF